MAKKSKDKQVTHIEKDDLKARQAAINEAIKVIEKEYGKGAIMDISSENPIKVEAVSSGSLAIDSALGIGGYPKGRIVEVYLLLVNSSYHNLTVVNKHWILLKNLFYLVQLILL